MEYDGFEWDEFNVFKSSEKHGVYFWETEEVFYHRPMVYPNLEHRGKECRHIAFGRTNSGRLLTVVFTLRKRGKLLLIRPISSRPMHSKERLLYEKANQKNS